MRTLHYGDVIMGAMASQITSLTIVYSTVYSDADKENIKALRHWPLCGEFTGDQWIPRTNDQLRGKCFHLMTSSWGCTVYTTLLYKQLHIMQYVLVFANIFWTYQKSQAESTISNNVTMRLKIQQISITLRLVSSELLYVCH